MAVASIWPLNHSLSSSTIKPFITPLLAYSYCKHFSSHFRCKISHNNSVAVSPNGGVADRVLTDLQSSGVIACLRSQSAEVAIEAARAALRGGISVLEITMSTPGVFEALQCLVQEYPSASLGVGTVLDRADAKDALKLGAKFLMSPAMVKDILDDVVEGQALYIPGATTPTEILFAYNAGAKIIKIYPVSALGGVDYIAALKKPFPHIPLVASQGITIDTVDQYIARGASAVVLSDAIFDKRAMDERNFVLIRELASFAALKGSEAVRSDPVALLH
ncbi:khg/kdpg aldolase [Phtheirospermum japonicum]|uniref:Khg/kdpg aldolase n=1 Tax=Phtheirospermum japonicum TaxID=374723 RepID=A0A830BDR8_9LAMI|nr:khg/kdpg aldolase [Phtheirospermum japonicum]